ncbi:uncharacterized protein EI97DRAFT_25754 [Westerdykella ornata]|uniref:Uncharacterized protein n=1 Tax=Westerdykella ornata TaxID=318751 RepID=A0A6A6K1P4_WESOR|nr:uncharacterized protein EI97DRAFT_25754 [Westerdykella ornata]KAF2281299.1 hypothetical protein EI97DRAFT_25754 [Westerdykella ornata]
MDIRKWLNDIVLPEQPPSPGLPHQDTPAPLLESHVPETRPKQGRRRKRSTTDSSFLEARTVPPKPKSPPPIRKEADTDESRDTSTCSDAHQPPNASSDSSSSSQRYARRPRRKTRPERYEPKSKHVKEQGAHASRHRNGESKQKKRKSRRKKSERPGMGLVQSFHAKNVPQDRLTLKPREKLGLFNKGRVSSPVKGRGLPDLVFSEMKFLQKQTDQPEATAQPGLTRKKRKKDHAHAKEEEISAYFTSVRPALAERDVNTRAKGDGQWRIPEGAEGECARFTHADNALPTVEVPRRASFLGFGSKGPEHRSGSYISWSESIRAPSVPPLQARAGSAFDAAHLSSARDNSNKRPAQSGGGDLHSPASPSASRGLPDGSNGCFQMSCLTPANRRPSRCQSFPNATSSSWPTGLYAPPEGRQTVVTAHSLSSLPTGKPVRAEAQRDRRRAARSKEVDGSEDTSLRSRIRIPRGDSGGLHEAFQEDGDGYPQTSSTLGRLLHQCDSALDGIPHQARVMCEPPGDINNPGSSWDEERGSVNINITETDRRPPVVRFSGVETYRPLTTEYAGPSIYEEQERREREATLPQPGYGDSLQSLYTLDQEEELDEWEEDVDAHVPRLGNTDWDALLERPGTIGYNGYTEDGRGTSYLDTDDVVANGFWRPHKLY